MSNGNEPDLSFVDQEIFTEFIVEAQDGIQNLEKELASVNDGHLNDKQVEEVMRIMHTLKGTSGFVGMANLSTFTHQMEDLMINLRDEVVMFSKPIIDTIFRGIDYSRKIVDRASTVPEENQLNDDEVIFLKKVTAINEGKEDLVDNASSPTFIKQKLQEAIELLDDNMSSEFCNSEQTTSFMDKLTTFINAMKKEKAASTKSNVKETIDGPDDHHIQIHAPENVETKAAATETPPSPVSTVEEDTQALKEKADKFIRVDQEKIDDLMYSIGSLIIKSDSLNHFYQLFQENRTLNDEEIHNFYDNMVGLNKIIFNLENNLMEVRKLPAKKLFNKFFYVVRNTAKKVNKNVNLKLINEDLRIDSSILNEMEPVLTHIVRNSIDHGIEDSEIRKVLNKPDSGSIRLEAKKDDANFYITIQDDGGGIDREKICNVIVKKGMKTASELEQMSDEDVFAHIFYPGFSSAEKVTDISGRGVGLDVVKTTIDKLNGTYAVHSELGKGTTFELVIPQMTTLVTKLAIITKNRNQQFAFLLDDVENMLAHPNHQFTKHKEKRMMTHQDDIYPVYYLDEIIGKQHQPEKWADLDKLQLILLNSEQGRFGVVIDELIKVQTVVVKQFEYDKMAEMKNFGGYTVAGNGDVILIADPNGIQEKLLETLPDKTELKVEK